MSIRLNGGRLKIDLGTGFRIDPTTTSFVFAFWAKKVGAFVDYDPFGAFGVNDPEGGTPNRDAFEFYNSNSGSPRIFEAADGGSAYNFGSPSLTVGNWYYIACYRPASGSNVVISCGDSTAMSGGGREHTGLASGRANPLRYITFGDLAQWGLGGVSTCSMEVAQPRLWTGNLGATDDADLLAKLLAENASATPVITSGLVMSLPMDSTSDTTDQSGHSIAWAGSGTFSDGASNPPSGAAGGSNVFPGLLFAQSAGGVLSPSRGFGFG